MKSDIFKCILISIFLFVCLGIKAEDTFTVNNMTFSLINTKEVAIESLEVPNNGIVIIPSEITYKNRTFTVSTIDGASGSLFKNPEKLIAIVIPNTIDGIASMVGAGGAWYASDQFRYCKNLKKVTIEDSDKDLFFPSNNTDADVREPLFINCPLEEVYIGRNIRYEIWDRYTYSEMLMKKNFGSPFKNSKTLKKVEFGNKVSTINKGCFYGCEKLKEVKIPKGVTMIPDCAFYHCYSLSHLVLHDNIQSIGHYVFTGISITSIVFPSGLETIGDNVFQDCNNLISVSINDKIKKISMGVFLGCTNLLKLTIGKSVEIIKNYAFHNTSIEMIESKIEDPSKCSIETGSAYSKAAFPISVYTFATLHVPMGTKNKYLASYPWSKFVDIREDLPSVVKTLKDNNSNNKLRYSLNGQRVSQPQKGITIIKKSDGSTIKIIDSF